MKPLDFVLGATLLLSTAGGAADVRYNYAANADFTQFKTYRWDERGPLAPHELFDQQIRTAIEAELAKKDLTPFKGTRPDVIIRYHFAASREVQTSTVGGGRVITPSGRVRGTAPRVVATSVERVGTLSFDMYTPDRHQVWHSVAEKKIEFKENPDKQAKNIANVVESMLKKYPPKQ